ncbi:MAG: hypothetical protein Q4C91_06090 [Eubacteriales bacterium]|nr:hypothetical protein [Eubacteriales bacterium]
MKSWHKPMSLWEFGETEEGEAGKLFHYMASGSLLENFFRDLRTLKGVPFEYLISDKSLLPNESLKFFYVDENWVSCLMDGASSVGRTTTFDLKHDDMLLQQMRGPADKVRTGFLLRSGLVRNWKGIRIEACDGSGSRAELERLEQIGEDIMIGIAAGKVERLAFIQSESVLSFGFEEDARGQPVLPVTALPKREKFADNDAVYVKKKRGTEAGGPDVIAVPMKQGRADRVVDLEKLMKDAADKLQLSDEQKNTLSAIETALELMNTPLRIEVKGVKL